MRVGTKRAVAMRGLSAVVAAAAMLAEVAPAAADWTLTSDGNGS